MTTISGAQHQMIMERFVWDLVLSGERDAGADGDGSQLRAAALARVRRLDAALADLDGDAVFDALSVDSDARDEAFRRAAREMVASLEMLAMSLGIRA